MARSSDIHRAKHADRPFPGSDPVPARNMNAATPLRSHRRKVPHISKPFSIIR